MNKIIPLFLLFIANSVFAKDANTISNEISNTAEKMFYTRKFESINKMDDEFRNSQSRLPDGRWKLTFIYENLGNVGQRGAEEEWKNKIKLVEEWINKTPDHPAPYLAKTKILIAYAWDARGNGWAQTVKDKQWKLFRTRIAEARKVLEDSYSITGSHPFWFYKMETIAAMQNWPAKDFMKLYERASNMFPTYYFIHFAAAGYFQPRWHGSKEELRKFVNNAVKKSKHKEGLTLYARIYWSQLGALEDNTFSPGYAEWPKMQQGFEDIMNDHPRSMWNLNAYAYYACMAKDWRTTKKLIQKIEANPHMSIWRSKSRFYTCKSLADKVKV